MRAAEEGGAGSRGRRPDPARRDRRSRARPRRAARALPGRWRRASAATRTTCCGSTTASPIGHGALGPRALAVDALRRHHAREQPHAADARGAAPVGRVRTRCRRSRSSRPARTSSCSRPSIASSRRGAGTAAEAGSAHPRRPVPRGAGGVLPRAARRAGGCRSPRRLPAALATLDTIVARVAAEYHERLAPAIERVWRDEIADIARDLRVWAAALAGGGEWVPEALRVQLRPARDSPKHDPASRPEPVVVDGRFKLRGSVDLIERRQDARHAARHRPQDRQEPDDWKTVIAAGHILQPVLYSSRSSRRSVSPVTSGRLFYCTAAGGFTEHEIPLNDAPRAGLEALEIIDRAIELGFLPAAPAERRVRLVRLPAVCGPHEEQRIARKSPEKLGDLIRRFGRSREPARGRGYPAAGRPGRARSIAERSTRRSSSRRRPARARRRSWSADPAHPGDRPRRRHEDRRGDVHREGGRRAEAAAARGARARAAGAGRDRGADRGSTTALGSLEEAHVSTIHGFCAELLRERPVEARVDPLFTVLTEGQAAAALRRGVRRLDPGTARRIRPKGSGARCGARCSPASGDGRARDGPDRPAAPRAWELASGATSPRPGPAAPSIASAAIAARRRSARVRRADREAVVQPRQPVLDTARPRGSSQEIALAPVVRPQRLRRLGSAARRSVARPQLLEGAQGRGPGYGQGVPRDASCSKRSTSLRARSTSSAWTPTPISPRAPAGAARAVERYERAEGARRARSTSSTCC
jgi:hypothetical protein